MSVDQFKFIKLHVCKYIVSYDYKSIMLHVFKFIML
jgi:hypothetical protein